MIISNWLAQLINILRLTRDSTMDKLDPASTQLTVWFENTNEKLRLEAFHALGKKPYS